MLVCPFVCKTGKRGEEVLSNSLQMHTDMLFPGFFQTGLFRMLVQSTAHGQFLTTAFTSFVAFPPLHGQRAHVDNKPFLIGLYVRQQEETSCLGALLFD